MALWIEGEVINPRKLGLQDLAALPGQVGDISRHVPGRKGSGVWLRAVLDASGIREGARFLTVGSSDGRFALSVPFASVIDSALVVYQRDDGAPLPVDEGGPIRLYVVAAPACGEGVIDACANVKGLGLLRLTRNQEADVGHAPH